MASNVTKTTLKTYFNTGDQPTESNFADFIDSNLNLGETATQTVLSSITLSGSLNISQSSTIGFPTATTSSCDAAAITINAPKFEIMNKLQAQVNDSVDSADVTVTNASVGLGDIVLGHFATSSRNALAGGQIVVNSVAAGSFKYRIVNCTGGNFADNTGYTASFAVIKNTHDYSAHTDD
jgi:hypothetical protein